MMTDITIIIVTVTSVIVNAIFITTIMITTHYQYCYGNIKYIINSMNIMIISSLS